MVRRRKTIVAVTIGAAGELGRATACIITAPPTRRTEGPKRDGEHQAEAQFHSFMHGSALIYPPPYAGSSCYLQTTENPHDFAVAP